MRAKACAKINLSLEVLGRRVDGYHQVTTVLQTVDLADRLYFEPAPGLTVECSQPELSGEGNLAHKAARALKEAAGCRGGAWIRVDKRIPVAMGLGGGSSDAAATLVALNRLWGLGLAVQELEELGRRLGADVPFFVRGGTSLGEGRGDVLRSLRPLARRWLVLVCPQMSVEGKTSRLYSMLGRDSYTDGRVTRALTDAIDQGRFSSDLSFNVFEQVAFDAYSGLDRVMRDTIQAGATFVHLSGTGPALYALASGEAEGLRIRDRLVSGGHRAWLLQTTGASSHLTPASMSN